MIGAGPTKSRGVRGRTTAELAQPLVAAPERTGRKLRRDVGFVGLLFASLGSIIGAGWLFGALYASSLAGPAAVISWVLGGGAVMLLALSHAELGGMYPVAGGSARFPRFAFGNLIGFTSGWVAFLSRDGRADHGRGHPPLHVELRLVAHDRFRRPAGADGPGLHRRSSAAAALLHNQRHGGALARGDQHGRGLLEAHRSGRDSGRTDRDLRAYRELQRERRVHALRVEGVFLALSSGGVIFAGLGFEQAVQLGGETRNPRRNIPFAIIGGMTVAIVLYIGLQVAFILALDPSELSKGWAAVSFSGGFGPFAALATALGLGWLAVLLYTDAIVSPGGTGLIYTGASARLTFALARNGFIPSAFTRLSPRGTPFFAIAFSFLCGLVILLPFPGWQQLVGFISAAAVAVYALAPLALGALRRQDPARPRPFRLPAASLLAPATFVIAGEILLFTGWTVIWKLIVAIVIGFALLGVSTATDTNRRTGSLDWRSAAWLWPYLLGMGAISYLSSFDTRTPSTIPLLGLHGPRNELTFGWDILAVALFSAAVYGFAIRSRLPAEQALEYIGDPMAEESETANPPSPANPGIRRT